tara:strand:+ start:523 stop:1566 length:1044 start_codon:yes stop_codon:yes gene_type:complete
MIKIIDCGSQLTQNIARRVRELGVFTEIVPFNTSYENVVEQDTDGLIISGGQFSVHDDTAPMYTKKFLEASIPILGICYGLQSISHLLGGKVISTKNREYGETKIKILKKNLLFKDINSEEFTVWMSHGDILEEVPSGFEVLAKSWNNHIASIQRDNIYAVQFHPEVDHTEHGRKILDNFLEICKSKRTWDPEKEYNFILNKTREKIEGKIGVGGISGGVDSTTVSVLLDRIAGENYHPIFIDNGLLRLNEINEVKNNLSSLGLRVHYVDASERFLLKLKGVIDSDEKRKIIGHEFIRVFEEEARKIPGASYLVQGTLYPDVIESVPIYSASSMIKRHHNVEDCPKI